MSDTSAKYLDGFLAAVGAGTVVARPPAPPAAVEPAPSPPDVAAPAPPSSVEEQIKRHLHPLDSFPRLLECVRENRPPGDEDRFRFQWFGLFYQGPRQDAFVLRLRLPGGRLNACQLRGLAEITQECAGGHVLLNSQGGLDVPGVPVRTAAEILRRVENAGLSARLTGGDCVQAIRGGEHDFPGDDGPGPEAVYPLVCELEQTLAHSRALADLPLGCELALRAAGKPGTVALEVGTGGGRFKLPASSAVSACLTLLTAWATGGDRMDRQKAGLAAFCAGLSAEQREALTGPAEWQPTVRPATGHEAGQPPSGVSVPECRLLSGQLACLARIAEVQLAGEIRLAAGRMFVAPAADDAATTHNLEKAAELR